MFPPNPSPHFKPHKTNDKAIRVTDREGPWCCETSRFPQFLDTRLTDDGEIISLTLQQYFIPRKIPGIHFCLKLTRPQGNNAAGRIRSIEKSNDLIENRTRDLIGTLFLFLILILSVVKSGQDDTNFRIE
jgi:hypothetical protein